MTIQIGRLTINNPATVGFDGRQLTLSGWMSGPSRQVVSAYRDTLLGYQADPDEEAIPIVWADDSLVDGMYRSLMVRVTPVVGVSEKGTFDVQYELSAELASRQVALEAVTVGGFRPNGAGTSFDTPAEVAPLVGVPADVVDYYDGVTTSIGGPFITTTRASDTGSVAIVGWGSHTAVARRTVSYAMPLASWYKASCLVERLVGSTWVPVAGRRVASGSSASLGWRIGNGLIRLSETTTTDMTFKVEAYDGSTWKSTEFEFAAAGFPLSQLNTVTIRRNSPECVVVRFSTFPNGGYDFPTYIDVKLSRGARFAELHLFSQPGQAITWGMEWNPDAAVTTLSSGGNSYGGRATTAVSSMRNYLFSAADVNVSGSVSNIDVVGSQTDWSVAIGQQIDSLSASTGESFTELFQQYLAPLAIRQKLIIR